MGSVSWPAVEAALRTDPERLPPELLGGVQQHLEGLVFGPASQQPLNLSWSPPRFECASPRPAGQPPRRIIDVVPFSYELDVLELRLHELNATVDLFVIVEAPITHRGLRKPLVFKQHARRFAAFASKIVHVVVPHAALREPLREALQSSWRQETFYPIQLAIQQAGWAAAVAHVRSAHDLLVLADVDELPGADLLHELKWCSHRRDFPLLLYSDFYRFDFGRKLGSHSWNAPVVVRRSDLPGGFDFVKFPFARKRDWASSGHHLNRFGPPALQLYKHLSNGEGGSVPAGGAALLRDPEAYGRPLIERGVRLCCENDSPLPPAVPDAATLPYVVMQNPEAFRGCFAGRQWAATRAALAAAAAAARRRIVVPRAFTPPARHAGEIAREMVREKSPGRHMAVRQVAGSARGAAGRRTHEAARGRGGHQKHRVSGKRMRRLRGGGRGAQAAGAAPDRPAVSAAIERTRVSRDVSRRSPVSELS